jgi:hypothetical protein
MLQISAHPGPGGKKYRMCNARGIIKEFGGRLDKTRACPEERSGTRESDRVCLVEDPAGCGNIASFVSDPDERSGTRDVKANRRRRFSEAIINKRYELKEGPSPRPERH